MGEVYRARDTRLERTVAIKILPAHLSDNADLHQRFEREARAVSSLNHPHICTLHDIGLEDGVDYLVMEYLEGETLADRLRRGPVPPEQFPRIAIEITDALDRAHKQRVIHRDLKPGNIMLTKAGVKLLDFGLAKLLDPYPAQALSRLSALPTERTGMATGSAMQPTIVSRCSTRSGRWMMGSRRIRTVMGGVTPVIDAPSIQTTIALDRGCAARRDGMRISRSRIMLRGV